MPSKNSNAELYNRRRFLNRVAYACAGALGVSAITYIARSGEPVYRRPEIILTIPKFTVDAGAVYPRMAIVHGTDAYRMVKAALEKLGGVDKFIKPGDRVLIKPNVAWDRAPEQAANTNPLVVAAIIKAVMSARPASVTVTDVSLNDPYRCFARSGIESAAKNAGAIIFIPSDGDFRTADLKGSLLTQWPVTRAVFEADKIINAPVVKHHSLSGATLSQKNWYGMLGGRRNQLHQDIHTSIADLAQAFRPTLTVMDATRVLMRNGPNGGSLSDVSVLDTIIAGTDEVAIDAYSMGLLGLDPSAQAFMQMAEKRGLGVTRWKDIHHAEFTV